MRNAMSWINDRKSGNADVKGQLAAISKARAVIEFSLDGKILTANENFLTTVGHTLAEVRGQHHSMFVEPACSQNRDWKEF